MMILLYSFAILHLFLNSKPCAEAALSALRIWGFDLVPSLFPYMVFTRLLAAQLRKKQVPAAASVILLGLVGGSPSGASVLAAYGNSLSMQKLFSLTALTGTLSPMFILNTLQLWMTGKQICPKLLISHIFGALLCFYIVSMYYRNKNTVTPPSTEYLPEDENAITQSLFAIFNIGGCIVAFSVSACIIRNLPFLQKQPEISALFHGILEVAGGAHAITHSFSDSTQKAVILAAISGFSGFSILTQNLFFLKSYGIEMKHLVAFGILRAAGSAGFMLLLISF